MTKITSTDISKISGIEPGETDVYIETAARPL